MLTCMHACTSMQSSYTHICFTITTVCMLCLCILTCKHAHKCLTCMLGHLYDACIEDNVNIGIYIHAHSCIFKNACNGHFCTHMHASYAEICMLKILACSCMYTRHMQAHACIFLHSSILMPVHVSMQVLHTYSFNSCKHASTQVTIAFIYMNT